VTSITPTGITVMPYAQTNIQLFNQLGREGWGDQERRQVHDAYELAMTLFAGHFRPNHKPFLAHLVGTASILAVNGASPTVVTAGLLHSAYSHGEFGDGSRGINDRKRRQVRRAVGSLSEAVITNYTPLKWNLSTLSTMLAHASVMSPSEGDVVFVKLADTLEDHLDMGLQYSPNKNLPGGAELQCAWRDALVKLAAALRHYALAADLERVLDPHHQTLVPEFLHGRQPGSFVVAPVSHRVRATVRLGRFYRRWRAKLLPARETLTQQAA
jgi:(p)ppGpp synthase/HD superfamily hydrolase